MTPFTQMIFLQSRYVTPGFKPFSYISYALALSVARKLVQKLQLNKTQGTDISETDIPKTYVID